MKFVAEITRISKVMDKGECTYSLETTTFGYEKEENKVTMVFVEQMPKQLTRYGLSCPRHPSSREGLQWCDSCSIGLFVEWGNEKMMRSNG